MKLQTDKTIVFLLLLACSLDSRAQSATENNPAEHTEIIAGEGLINKEQKKQSEYQGKIILAQDAITAEMYMIQRWQSKYNAYLKDASKYTQVLTAASKIYAEGMMALRYLLEIKNAIKANPQGIGASVAMDDTYAEIAAAAVKTYRMVQLSLTKGGKDNMLSGAERVQLLWMLTDELHNLNTKLKQMALSIATFNMKDVLGKITQGLGSKTHKSIADAAKERWGRAMTAPLKL